MKPEFVLHRAAFIASAYDRKAKRDILYNQTDAFHLCGLIERAASIPKSGSTHRRSMGSTVIDQAKAMFCRAHGVPHPQVWEDEVRPSCSQVRDALLSASVAEQAKPNAFAAYSALTTYANAASLIG